MDPLLNEKQLFWARVGAIATVAGIVVSVLLFWADRASQAYRSQESQSVQPNYGSTVSEQAPIAAQSAPKQADSHADYAEPAVAAQVARREPVREILSNALPAVDSPDREQRRLPEKSISERPATHSLTFDHVAE